MVPPLVIAGGVVAAGWVGNALFGGEDMQIVRDALPWTEAIEKGDSGPLKRAADMTGSHATKQSKFADDAKHLNKLLSSAWQGEASDAAQKKVADLEKNARTTAAALKTNAKNFQTQVERFDDLKKQIRHLDNPPPETSFGDRIVPGSNDTEDAVERNLRDAEHNVKVYEQYEKDTSTNAEGIGEEYGNPGQDFSTDSSAYDPYGNQDAWQSRQDAMSKAQEDARRAQEEARRRAEEQMRRQQEAMRQAQLDAQRQAQEEARRQQEAMRQAQLDAQRQAQEQAAAMRQGYQPDYQSPDFGPGSGTRAASYSPSAYNPPDFGPGSRPSGFGPTGSGSVNPAGAGAVGGFGPGTGGGGGAPGSGRSSGAMRPGGPGGSGAGGSGAGGMRSGAAGMGRGGMPMGGMMGAGAGKGQGEDKEHQRKIKYSENPDEVFGTDEKSVPPVIGDK